MTLSKRDRNSIQVAESVHLDFTWRTIVSLSQVFRELNALPEITTNILDRVVQLIGAEAAAVALRDPVSGGVVIRFTSGAWSAWRGQFVTGLKLLEQAIARGQPCMEECTSLGTLPMDRCQALFCMPLIAGHVCYGVLFASTSRPAGSDALDLLALIAEWMAYLLRSQVLDGCLRKLAQQVEGRERLINRILESIPSSLIVINAGLRVVSANRNFLEKSRRGPQNTFGRPLTEVFPRVLLDYMQLDRKVQEIFRTGQAMEGDKVAFRSPGLPTRIYYYCLLPIKIDKTIENVMLLLDDITEREQLGRDVRKAEQHLASLVECANDIVASLDSHGRILTWNRAAVRLSGLSEQQATGCFLPALCAPGQQDAMASMLQSLTNERRFRSIEANLLTVQSKEVPIAWNCSPMCDDTQNVVGIVAVGHDLTERYQLQAQLIHSAKMASLGVMAGGIAHELRNPLGVISAAVQLMQENLNNEQMLKECSERAYAATKRAALVIENLLKFARPQNEQGMREVDIHGLLDDSIALLNNQLTLNKVLLHRSYAPDMPTIEGNASLLQQVFTNMILNACNAMPRGGTLAISTTVERPGRVQIRFVDTGCGIPEEHLTQIFDPFFTTMPVGRGTGLGLSISYNIIQQHQGSIKVQSQVGRGTEFTLDLPTRLTNTSKALGESDLAAPRLASSRITAGML